MPPINAAQITALQRKSDNIRNICILAHVDHGKTSLSDCLLATNGIISPKLAGRVRFLDSRPDEQLRGITMESSAISLLFRLARRATPESEPVPEDFLINLIDSPGHIDFSSEVSTASRLCDGAIVLVDAVEGVCSQTVTVLRQTWIEHIKPVLVINKIDRLITELQLTPEEAFDRMLKLVEQVNAVMGSFFAGERMEEDLRWREKLEERVAAAKAAGINTPAGGVASEDTSGVNTPAEAEFTEKDDEDIYFAPEKHNVIFASAIDGWAFTIRQFAGIYEKKLGVKKEVLEKVLWGKYYFDPKTKRVISEKHLKGRNLKPMFVQLVLNNIWAVYQCTVLNKDADKIAKIAEVLKVKILPRELKSKDPHSARSLMSSIFMQWIPLSTALLVTVIEQLPSPPAGQSQRMPFITESAPGADNVSSESKDAVANFSTAPEAPVVVYVSKMISVPESELKKSQRALLSAEEMRQKRMEVIRRMAAQAAEAEAEDSSDMGQINTALRDIGFKDSDTQPEEKEEKDDREKEHLIGFARIYSGTIKKGQELYVLGPKYNPAYPDQHVQKITVESLYYMMGKDLEPLEEVPAGNVFGIGGLEGKILKNGTLTSLPTGGLNLAGVNLGSAPIVRVALEPNNPAELGRMVEGLKMLEQADPCAEYIVQDNGEHVILTAGELHLERCLKDLRERFAKIEIQASPPIVPFRETIVAAAEMSPPKGEKEGLPRGTMVAQTPSKEIEVRLQVRPLPVAVTEFLVANAASIKALYAKKVAEGTAVDDEATATAKDDVASKLLGIEEVKARLRKAFATAPAKEREIWKDAVEKIVAFGPRRVGPNLLIDGTESGELRKLLAVDTRTSSELPPATRDFEDKLSHAFQLSTSSGPLCNEPVRGICCIIESFTLPASPEKTFEVITTVSSAIRSAFLDWSPRLMLAMYSVDIQTSTEVLGKVHDLISQRRGRTISEDQEEGTPFWTIKALLPVIESFGFADEIRKRTSGSASPQLVFYGYEMFDLDPFWTPFTEEELEDLGDVADRENVARRYMDKVRSRKGLAVKKRVVERAEKQKTLKR